jgi:hypothetical protein
MIDPRLHASAAAWRRDDLAREAARASVGERRPRPQLLAALTRAARRGRRPQVVQQPAREAGSARC